MVLIDTSAWIEYLRGTGSPYNTWIRDAIVADQPLGWTEPILYELTAGARSPRRAADLRALLLRGPILSVEGLQDWEDAAQLYRAARSKGLTVRSSIDCLIAAVALRTSSPVLALDRDFDALAKVSDLVLEHPQP
ncbi:MAG: PIN domain nuclease [Nitriliruptor sp.]|uniref:type II toxin-antitoxin system VapC family toxin n=1 Tax=Nitriliruptor sp. TaxID=2448056 RepID=UPI0034A098E6